MGGFFLHCVVNIGVRFVWLHSFEGMILKDKASNGLDIHHQPDQNKDMEGNEDEIILAEDKTNEGDEGSFDAIIGCIEDIVIDQKFQDMQEDLLRSHCDEFDETSEENKLVYT